MAGKEDRQRSSGESPEKEPLEPSIKQETGAIILEPALRQIGTTDCPVCKRDVAVFLTRNKRPFVNCSYCSARIFYNGRESMRRLKKKMKAIEDE